MIVTFLKHKLLLVFVFTFFMTIHLTAQADVLTEADQMPYFAGCEEENDAEEKRNCSDKNLVRFISNQLVYPGTAREQQIQGTVYVSFIVDEFGNVVSPTIVRDIGGGCGAAALELLRLMPKWEPAIHRGEKAKVKLNLPIHYSLKNDAVNEKAQNYQINWGSLATQKVSKQELVEHLDKTLHVRDAYGNDKPVSELVFAFEKKRNYLEGSSNGEINDELKNIVGKCKKGGVFSIMAVIQVKGEFIYMRRSFEVI